MYLMRIVAKHIGAMDNPTDAEGKRHIHKVATPKLGGLGIFLGFLFVNLYIIMDKFFSAR